LNFLFTGWFWIKKFKERVWFCPLLRIFTDPWLTGEIKWYLFIFTEKKDIYFHVKFLFLFLFFFKLKNSKYTWKTRTALWANFFMKKSAKKICHFYAALMPYVYYLCVKNYSWYFWFWHYFQSFQNFFLYFFRLKSEGIVAKETSRFIET